MSLTRLEIHNFRLLREVVFEPGEKLNVISGCNAAGKTTLIEAIHVLATGRSFRTRRSSELIRRGAEGLVTFGIVREGVCEHRLGLQLNRDGRVIRVDGEAEKSAAMLAQHVPLQAITPELHYEFLRSSRHRRGLLDWWLFHVEHDFYPRWLRYQRLLGQRNAALRNLSAPRVCFLWDEELAATGEELDRSRQEFFALLREEFLETATVLLEGGNASLTFKRGWEEGGSLLEQLRRSRTADQRRGYTHLGPHHADLTLGLQGDGARTHASHGQQKILVIALRLAQIRLFMQKTRRRCVLLADDIGAEFDRIHRERVWGMLAALGTQVFVTTMEQQDFSISGSMPEMFHVKQGKVQPVPSFATTLKKSNPLDVEMLK